MRTLSEQELEFVRNNSWTIVECRHCQKDFVNSVSVFLHLERDHQLDYPPYPEPVRLLVPENREPF